MKSDVTIAKDSEIEDEKRWGRIPHATGFDVASSAIFPLPDNAGGNGIGDACRFYFGNDGGWRMPTYDESRAYTKNASQSNPTTIVRVVENYSAVNPNWIHQDGFDLLPAGGSRNSGLVNQGDTGAFRTARSSGDNAFSLTIQSAHYVQHFPYPRYTAYPIRCVKP